jgi:hypothetical protein
MFCSAIIKGFAGLEQLALDCTKNRLFLFLATAQQHPRTFDQNKLPLDDNCEKWTTALIDTNALSWLDF